MGGFLSLYKQNDRVELGGGYYVDVKRFLSRKETERADAVRISPEIKSEMTAGKDGADGAVRSVVTTVNTEAYNTEILAAAIIDWNLTDDGGSPLPLPPYIPGKPTGPDAANLVRRESIGLLPAFAVKRILEQIATNEKAGADAESLAAFPGESESTPPEA